MKKKLFALVLLAGGSMFAQSRFSFGVSIGNTPRYYAPSPVVMRPVSPGPGYVWVEGYRQPRRFGRSVWIPGHWERRGYVNGYRATPRYDSRYDNRYDNRYNR